MKIIIEVTLTDEGEKAAVTDPKFTNIFEKELRDALRDEASFLLRGPTKVPYARAVTVRAVQ